MTQQSTVWSPRGRRKWKNLLGKRVKKSRELSKHCKWTIEKEKLKKYIWNHEQRSSYIKCPQKLQIDIECGELNPFLSLLLYPFGLFGDENKSATLLVKVVVPDDCPPLPLTDHFSLSWDICTAETYSTKLVESSKKPIKISFDRGMLYINKFFPYTLLQQHSCNKFEIHMCTTHLSQEMNTASDAMMIHDHRVVLKLLGTSYDETLRY